MRIPTTASGGIYYERWDFQSSLGNQRTKKEGRQNGRGINPVNK